jgi:hypothetical protein
VIAFVKDNNGLTYAERQNGWISTRSSFTIR